MPESAKQPRRSVVILARIITAAVGIAGAETLLWFVGYPPWWRMDPNTGGARADYSCDADLGWSAHEGRFTMAGLFDNRPFELTNWSGGRRATAKQEPAGDALRRPQVMFFGDSYIQGYGLTDSDTLPWIVQQKHPELNVSNFGAGLYGTYQSWLAIQKWMRQPATVYHLVNGFHEERNSADPAWLRIYKPQPAGCFFPFAEISGGDLTARRGPGNVVWALSRHSRLVAMAQEYRDMIESHGRQKDKRRLTEMLLVKMNDLVAAHGGQFVAILFDMPPDQRKEYRAFLDSRHIAYVDCDHPELDDRSNRLADGHPTGKLNALLAQWIEPLPVVSEALSAAANPPTRSADDPHRNF